MLDPRKARSDSFSGRAFLFSDRLQEKVTPEIMKIA